MDKCFENYPGCIVFASNLLSFAIYILGSYIMYQLGLVWLAAYIIYILLLEVKLLKNSCPNCYYYGKVCAFGRGKISALLFKKGDNKSFCKKKLTWKDILPDFLVSIIPILVGIILLVVNFDLMVLASVILLVLLTSAGNGFVRGKLACKYCKQRKLGCPAEKLFKKK